jgi:ABC-type branched-subunit amino acid transport system substrate-binding protein
MTMTRRTFSIASGAALLANSNLARAQSEGKIILGQSAAFTGPAAQLGIQFYQGARVCFDQVNAEGGVNKRLIEIRNLDDGYEPDR